MVLIIIGTVGVIASAVACFLLAKLKKPIRIAGILVAVFFCIGLVGVASDRDFPRITSAGKTETETKTDTETETEFENSTESETETKAKTEIEAETTDELYFISKKEINEGEVFTSISQVWKDIKITETHDDIYDSTFARVDVYVNEGASLYNAKKFYDIITKIRNNCSNAFEKADYIKVLLYFKVPDYEGNPDFYIALDLRDGQYIFENHFSPEEFSLSDEEYRVAINTIFEDVFKQSFNEIAYEEEDTYEDEDTYKQLCKEYSFEDVERYPQKYIGEKAYFKCKVWQVSERENEVILLVDVINPGSGTAGSLYVYYERKSSDVPRILEDDYIKMWGELDGLKTYENILGQSITVPRFNMVYYTFKGTAY